MGLNGSGKSTLLKMINGVMRPDVGTVRTRGRIAGLIATGAGFHPQLSGNENIRLNAAILGMSEKEINRKYDEIVAFSEIDTKFLQTEVGHYSSGMSARLGFSVAIHVDSEIFLADEVLAVGDRPFKRKCLQKMEEVRDSGRTLFYVSHAAGSVRKMCTRVLILEKGRLIFDGDVDEGIKILHYDDDKAENEPDRDEELEADEELGRRHLSSRCSTREATTRVAATEPSRASPGDRSALAGREGRVETRPLTNLRSIGASSGNYTFVVTQIP